MEQESKETQLNEDYRRMEIDLDSAIRCIDVSMDESKILTGHDDVSLQLGDSKTMAPINELWIDCYI